MSNYASRLEEEIERLGVSALANQAGVARNTLYNWVSKGNVPLNMLMVLGGLGLDIQYVVSGSRTESALATDEIQLLALYRAASLPVKMAAVGALSGGGAAAAEGHQGAKQIFHHVQSSNILSGDLIQNRGKSKREK